MANNQASQATGGRTTRLKQVPVGDHAALTQRLAAAPIEEALKALAPLVHKATEAAQDQPTDTLAELATMVYERIERHRSHAQSLSGICGSVDEVIRAGTGGFVISGWLAHHSGNGLEQVTAVSLGGRRIPLVLPLPARARPAAEPNEQSRALPDEARSYAAFAACEGLPAAERWWFVETVFGSGAVERFPFLLPPPLAPRGALEALLALAEPPHRDLPRLCAKTLAPAIRHLRATRREAVLRELVYGVPPHEPSVSVVVPLLGRLDLLRHQIARLSNDPEFRASSGQAELIYVVDDTQPGIDFERLCRSLHDIYGVPFRALQADAELDVAQACNAGASIAIGGALLLMAVGILPKHARWLSQLHRQYRALERCGVLGCRLLYEDGSIGHAGLGFRRSPDFAELWTLDRRLKGLPTGFDRESGAAPVPAVDGACMMVDRTVFGELGGLSEDYVSGGLADADFCLKAQRRGLFVYYTPEIEAYWLDEAAARFGQGAAKLALGPYNMWLCGEKWAAVLAQTADDDRAAT